MSRTGGSTNLEPRLLTMNLYAQNDTLSGLNDLTTSIRCNSFKEESHSPYLFNLEIMLKIRPTFLK
jgi:hypothetical protein